MTAKLKKAAAAVIAAAMTIGFGSVGAGAANNSKANTETDELSSAMSAEQRQIGKQNCQVAFLL